MKSAGRSHEDIVAWLRAAVAAELRLDPATISVDRALTFYGLDSLTAATIAGDFSDWLGQPLPENVLAARATIQSLADRFAGPAVARPTHHRRPGRQRFSDRIGYAGLDYRRAPRLERTLTATLRALVKVTSDVRVEGLDLFPAEGPVLVASNHLHILDAVWMLAIFPRRTILLVAEEFERTPGLGWLLNTARVIYISRSAADRAALGQALVVLREGGAMAVAPEGKLSRTGGLIRAHSGIAYIAIQSGVSVTPAAMWGQERAWSSWLRLRRVRLNVRFGSALSVPAGPAGPRELRRYTDQIMRGIASLLPPEYRGVYAAR
jgi:1-acyl-sn-glycerol-3-phosphate acyltransferase